MFVSIKIHFTRHFILFGYNVTKGWSYTYDLTKYIIIQIFHAHYRSSSWKLLSLVCIILRNNNKTVGINSITEIII